MEEPKSMETQRVVKRIYPLSTHPHFPLQSEAYLEWLPRVARFSFELGHTFYTTAALERESSKR